MTKTVILKRFFKKFFDIDAHGWGMGSVLNDVIENNETLGGSGSSGGGNITFFPLTYDDSDRCITTASYNDVKTAMENSLVIFTDGGITGATNHCMVVNCGPNPSGYMIVLNNPLEGSVINMSASTPTDPLTSST